MVDLRPKRIAEFIEPFRVEPGRRVRLPRDFDPAGTRKQSTHEAKEILAAGGGLLAEYQERLAARTTTASSWSSRRWTRRARTARSAMS